MTIVVEVVDTVEGEDEMTMVGTAAAPENGNMVVSMDVVEVVTVTMVVRGGTTADTERETEAVATMTAIVTEIGTEKETTMPTTAWDLLLDPDRMIGLVARRDAVPDPGIEGCLMAAAETLVAGKAAAK
jgi:hypothetical protein